MRKRIIDCRLTAVVLILWIGSICQASERRNTPLVRAVERAKAAVVNIHSEKTASTSDSLFSTTRGRKINGMGTGIVVDPRGYIVTNYHVVAGVDALRATLIDGGQYDAQVVSFDRQHDLAIIKIDPSRSLQLMPLGTSSDLMLGETVFAVGNAFGYEHTVTSGIISALSRDVDVNEKQSYKNLIQTDASINPGNSGGPLLNLDGEVIGINVAIRAGAQRIGFAIPVDDARRVIAQLLSIEQLNSTYHGLNLTDVKSGKRRLLRVDSATKDSPAATAGFKAGDVIVKAGKVNVVDGADVERALLGRRPGDEVPFLVKRNEKTETLTLVLAATQKRQAASPDMVVRGNLGDTTAEKSWRALGLRLTRISSGNIQLAPTNYRGGMRVTRVRPQSPAAMNGIRQGDILVGLHEWETTQEDDLSYVLGHPKLGSFNPLKFFIVRDDETLFGYLRLTLNGQ